MNLRNAALTALFVSLAALPAVAQTTQADALPARSRAEVFVKKTPDASYLTTLRAAVETLAPAAAENLAGEGIVRTALQYLGARYRSGSRGPSAFDCSGFTSYVYGKQDISINRSSRSQFTQGMPIASKSDLQKGDLVFFGGSRASRSVGHVGIVTEVDAETGQFKFVHAARTGVQVDKSSSAYYARRYIGARRIVE